MTKESVPKDSSPEAFAVKRVRHYNNTFQGDKSAEFVLQDLMTFCNFMGDGFSKDPHETAYMAGRRSVILYVLDKLQQSEFDVAAKMKIDNILNREFSSSSDGKKSYEDSVFGK